MFFENKNIYFELTQEVNHNIDNCHAVLPKIQENEELSHGRWFEEKIEIDRSVIIAVDRKRVFLFYLNNVICEY